PTGHAGRRGREAADGLEVTSAAIPGREGDSNVAARAAGRLAAELGIAPRARIRLAQRIPVGAGLGGGSADAAVTLLLLARLWDSPLSAAGLSDVAASVGSDVPFFLQGGEADVTGRGERVTPREDGPVRQL